MNNGVSEATMQPLPEVTLQALQRHFHGVILGRAAELVEQQALPLPVLDPVLPSEEEKGWFAVPGMYGGFAYWWEGDRDGGRLIVESWCRVVDGSGQRHEVTPNGSTLVAEGLV
jgi:hypothetical protein